MFLLVSGRHVGAHLGGHQHGVSLQISINLGKTFLRISSIRKIAVTWILARVFAYLRSFYFQILGLIYWTVLIFYFDLFWMAWHWKPAICNWQGVSNDDNNCFHSKTHTPEPVPAVEVHSEYATQVGRAAKNNIK